mgnify:CR=1 FL=1
MAARAAGKLPIGGLWQQVKDLEGQEEASRLDRQLGMSGELILHPGQVEVANRAYSLTVEEIAYYRGMIEALEKAQVGGRASVLYEGEHIDIAHVNTARTMIEMAEEFGCCFKLSGADEALLLLSVNSPRQCELPSTFSHIALNAASNSADCA